MKKKLALIGAGGHAREVAAHLNQPVLFFEEEPLGNVSLPLSSFNPKEHIAHVAVGNPLVRQRLVELLPMVTEFFSVIHPSALILNNDVYIGKGSFIGANCILTTNIKLGDHCLLNRGVQIGHDTVIDDYFSAMPAAIIGGNCSIGKSVFVGAGTCIKEKITISNNIIIGMSAGVVTDLFETGTYVGLPAKKTK